MEFAEKKAQIVEELKRRLREVLPEWMDESFEYESTRFSKDRNLLVIVINRGADVGVRIDAHVPVEIKVPVEVQEKVPGWKDESTVMSTRCVQYSYYYYDDIEKTMRYTMRRIKKLIPIVYPGLEVMS